MSDEQKHDNRLLFGAVLCSTLLCALRLQVARGTGFGDAEALYAVYALHPQPAYLDHPGLIGSIARLIGDGAVPTPELTHVYTALAATLVPWVGALAARAAGASVTGMLATALGLMLVPELAIGLFGLSPDLPLALTWLGALACAAHALRSDPKSFGTLVATLGLGALVGFSMLAKASGGLLGLAVLGAFVWVGGRRRWLTLGPWGALAVAAVLVYPVVHWEVAHHYPMLRHRFVDTQSAAGLSLRNLGALLGGQLAYVTPPFLLAAGFVALDLRRRRTEDAVSRMLWLATVVPALPLALLCLWSRVAEPHWLAPAYLALAVHYGRSRGIGGRLGRACLATGGVIVLLAWAWVKTPLPMRLLGHAYQARYDVANDLFAWGPGGRLLEQAVATATVDSRRVPVVVGPHWIICAQAQARLGPSVPVGCNGPVRDDFDDWYPRARWLDAPSIVYVTDSRFNFDAEKVLPAHSVRSVGKVEIRRGGVVVRSIWVTHLEKTED